ncbi:hypothetical protein F7725_023354 [Dissostichus mawsoni]|uniref:SOCS box domain-containing protein n=1 Tax=Dissostichus mawsoni TaxID=36200 RepID=A0A7J5Z2L9_DISMA|nr:hypothetical protein F7725_023354 [Dissostichus mawsoni]
MVGLPVAMVTGLETSWLPRAAGDSRCSAMTGTLLKCRRANMMTILHFIRFQKCLLIPSQCQRNDQNENMGHYKVRGRLLFGQQDAVPGAPDPPLLPAHKHQAVEVAAAVEGGARRPQHLHQDVPVAGEVVSGSGDVVEAGAVPAASAQTRPGRRAEVRGLEVALAAAALEHEQSGDPLPQTLQTRYFNLPSHQVRLPVTQIHDVPGQLALVFLYEKEKNLHDTSNNKENKNYSKWHQMSLSSPALTVPDHLVVVVVLDGDAMVSDGGDELRLRLQQKAERRLPLRSSQGRRLLRSFSCSSFSSLLFLSCSSSQTSLRSRSQPLFVVLVSCDVVAGGDQLVVHAGDVAADPRHLGGGVERTLLRFRLQLHCLRGNRQGKWMNSIIDFLKIIVANYCREQVDLEVVKKGRHAAKVRRSAVRKHHPFVGSPLGEGLHGGMVVLRPRQPVFEPAQEGLLLGRTLDLHHHLPEHVLLWKSQRFENSRLTVQKDVQHVSRNSELVGEVELQLGDAEADGERHLTCRRGVSNMFCSLRLSEPLGIMGQIRLTLLFQSESQRRRHGGPCKAALICSRTHDGSPEITEPRAPVAAQGLSLEERTAGGGETALTLAVTAGLVQNVKNLLENGASPHNTNAKNESPLLLGNTGGGGARIIRLMVCRKRWTAMHEAAKVGNVDILMLLLRNGGRVNQKDVSGGTPLAVAVEHSHYHIIEILLNCGSSVNAQACNGESILLDAALKMLIPLTTKKAIKAAGQSPVHSASEAGQSRCLKHLLACGFDVNYRMNARNSDNYSDMRRSALYFAVSNGDAECSKILLAAGAKTDLDPLCCLLVAVRSGRYDIVKLLLAAKADVNCYFTVLNDTVFPTALQYCLKDEVMMRLLLNNGYKVERCFHCHHDDDFREANEGGEDSSNLCCVMHLSGTVVRTLLDYVNHVQICSKLRLLLKKQREWPDICDPQQPSLPAAPLQTGDPEGLTLKRLNKPEVMDSHIFPPRLKHFILRMDAAEDLDEDDLMHYDVQMSIQESVQRPERSEAMKLVGAIKQGDMLALRQLCDFPASFSQADERGWFPLHWAVVQPLVLVLETVLYASFRLTLEEKTSEGETFLTLAVGDGLLENVKLLLENGASPHTTNSKNETPLLLGAQVEQVVSEEVDGHARGLQSRLCNVMELLLQRGGKVSETDHTATLESWSLLIKHGADVNAQAPNGDSVLYDAAGSGDPDCLNILLQNGANPNVHNLSSQLPVHHAAYEGHHLEALRILIPITTRRALRVSGHSPVHSAADGGNTRCLELLLQKGFDVNAQLAPHISDNYGDMRKSPLYFAVSNGDATCTEILLKSGANPNLDPLCCLLVAVRSGCYDIVKLLLAAKADVNCYFTVLNDTVFPTALQYCLKDEVMMRLLLNNGYNAEKCFCCHHEDDWDELSEAGYSQDQERKSLISWLDNLVGRVVSILLEYVGQVSLCSKLTKTLEEHKEWPHIHWTLCNPRSLSHLSRVVIRKHLSCSSMASAPLPNRLKDYLLFKESDLDAKIICREDCADEEILHIQ